MYNPYDLVKININGKKMDARPMEFDSEIADNMTMLNAHGDIVRPTKLSTICPDCGGGMVLDVPLEMLQINDVDSLNTLFESIDWPCKLCHPDAPPPENPFMNPVDEERVSEHELDPLLHDPAEEVKQETTTVADRMGAPRVSAEPLDLATGETGLDLETTKEQLEEHAAEIGEDLDELLDKAGEHFTHDEISPTSSAAHGTNSSLAPPDDVAEEAQEDTSEDTEEEEAEEPQPDPEVEEEAKETPSEPEKKVELELGDEIGEEEDIEDDLDDLEDLEE